MDSTLSIRYDRDRKEFVLMCLEGRRMTSKIVVKQNSTRGAEIAKFAESCGLDLTAELPDELPGQERLKDSWIDATTPAPDSPKKGEKSGNKP